MTQNFTSIHSFQLLDDLLAQYTIYPLSLNPHKTTSASFVELGNLIFRKTSNLQVIQTLRETLEHILYALLDNFPDNIFWDFDFMVRSMLTQALVTEESPGCFLETFGDKVVSLMHMFGKESEIRFRYVHDFIYGFDWAKWVQKDTQNRAIVEPFSMTFLDCLLARGKEILQLIRVGDTKYHRLTEQQNYRNPFCFSREPDDEFRLLTSLAKKQLIPVATWNWNACPIWNQPFHQMREQLSLELRIPRNG
ncbi:MAG: hypothetical protein SAK29_30470 [Scytonema sp. PMC 1069.18]|nr:hypothetical protein [Scytonema sp. PMC 1069.18]MEC4879882.1 hypothetical protein [Scytonema sp. PMC 1070.18]